MPSGTQHSAERRARALALALAGAAAAVLVSLATLQCRSKDFISYYAAGTLARVAPHHLYSLARQSQLQEPLADSHRLLPWAHPAAEALLFAPLSVLSYRNAFMCWAIVNVCLLAWAIFLLRDRFKAADDSGTYAIAAASGIPILAGFWGGQDHLLTLLLYILGYINAEQDRDLIAGFFFGLALIRFQVTLPLLLLFMVLRRWRVLAGASLGALLLAGCSFALVGPQVLQKYSAILRFLGQMHDTGTTTYMPTIRGFMASVRPFVRLPDTLPDRLTVTLTLVISAAILLFAMALWRRQIVPFAQLFASAVMIALAVDYHGFMYEWTLLLLAGVLLLESRPEWRWVFLALGGLEIAVLLSHTGLLGLLAPVLVLCGLFAARSEQRLKDSFKVATS